MLLVYLPYYKDGWLWGKRAAALCWPLGMLVRVSCKGKGSGVCAMSYSLTHGSTGGVAWALDHIFIWCERKESTLLCCLSGAVLRAP